jgi:hypothetical protein
MPPTCPMAIASSVWRTPRRGFVGILFRFSVIWPLEVNPPLCATGHITACPPVAGCTGTRECYGTGCILVVQLQLRARAATAASGADFFAAIVECVKDLEG